MMSNFLSKLLISKQALFTDSSVSIFEMPFSLQPIESLVEMQREMEIQFDGKSEKLLKRFGNRMSESIISHFKSRFGMAGSQLSSAWLNMFGLSGFGKLETVEMSDKTAMFRLESSPIARIYLSKYKVAQKPVCFIISGMLENYFENMSGKKCVCEETSCMANGKRNCIFQVTA